MQFEWDPNKRLANLTKHGLDFADVAWIDWDSAHVIQRSRSGECRYLALGYLGERLHAVVYVIRGVNFRIISFRKANRREERYYAQTRRVG